MTLTCFAFVLLIYLLSSNRSDLGRAFLGWINPNKFRDSNMLAFAFKCGIISSHSYLCEGLPWPSYLPSSLIAMPGHRADTLSRGDWECNWNGLEKPWGIWFKLYSCVKYLYIYIYIFKSLCLYPSMQLVSICLPQKKKHPSSLGTQAMMMMAPTPMILTLESVWWTLLGGECLGLI